MITDDKAAPNTLKNLGEQVAFAIEAAKQTGVRLELHGDCILLREGAKIYAIGLIDNGEAKYIGQPRG